jgi:hypothetical protein
MESNMKSEFRVKMQTVAVVLAAAAGVAVAVHLVLAQDAPKATPSTKKVVNADKTWTLTEDLVLTGADSLEVNGTKEKPCTIIGSGRQIKTAGESWTGHIIMRYCTVRDLGTAAKPAMVLSQHGKSSVDIRYSTFDASSNIELVTNDASDVTYSHNTVLENALYPADMDPSSPPARGPLEAAGNSPVKKYFQGNRIYKAGPDLESPHWLVGGDTDAEGNIIIGYRAGIKIGADSVVKRNYTHVLLWVDPVLWTWIQTGNIPKVAAGTVVEDNVIRVGEWTIQFMDGELRNNVILEAQGHNALRIGKGKVHHNIFAHAMKQPGRYGNQYTLSADSFILQPYATDGFEVYNNVFDGSYRAAMAGFAIDKGSTMPSVRSNVFYNMRLAEDRAVIGGGFNEGVPKPRPDRLGYADYNLFHYNTIDHTLNICNYGVGVAGKTERKDNGFALHDVPVGGAVNASVDPKFRGPLPTGFPFSDEDILKGKVSISEILAYYRYIYSPAPGSPLIGAGDPQDGAGNDIGAVRYSAVPTAAPAIVSTNKPPAVEAGKSYAIKLPAGAYMAGSAEDDNLPAGRLTITWSKVSGPGAVTFANASDPLTSVSFSAPGVYVLRLTASDGQLTSSDDVTITVGNR